MNLSSSKLIGLPVETRSGAHLGVVKAVDLNSETFAITQFYVRAALLPSFVAQQLCISPSQVVSLTNEKMVVEDAVLPAGIPEAAPTQT